MFNLALVSRGPFGPTCFQLDMDRWLDCIQIWYGCSLGISDDMINFWDNSIKNKLAAVAI